MKRGLREGGTVRRGIGRYCGKRRLSDEDEEAGV